MVSRPSYKMSKSISKPGYTIASNFHFVSGPLSGINYAIICVNNNNLIIRSSQNRHHLSKLIMITDVCIM